VQRELLRRAEPSAVGSYSLSRVEASDLFYGSTEEALLKETEQEAMAADPCRKVLPRSPLPKPRIKFNQSRPVDGWMHFWHLYGANNDSNKILCVAGAVTPRHCPAFVSPSLSVTLPDAHDPARPDALYVMD
jgi:hypothetical protein